MAKDPLAIMNAVASAMSNPSQKKKKAIMAKKGQMKDDSATDGKPEPDADDMPPTSVKGMKGKVPAKPNF